MNYELLTIDDRFFGADQEFKLEALNGYTWLSQIDPDDRALVLAVEQCMGAIRDTFRSVPPFEKGNLTSLVVADYDGRLDAELTALPYASQRCIPEFNRELRAALQREIPGVVSSEDSDMGFLISTMGMIYRDFRDPAPEVLDAAKEANLMAMVPVGAYERSLAAMSVTAINMTALAKHGVIELTDERKDAILWEMARCADGMNAGQARPEFVQAFKRSAIKLFSQAPTVEPIQPTINAPRL
jgi:hypothetical protein